MSGNLSGSIFCSCRNSEMCKLLAVLAGLCLLLPDCVVRSGTESQCFSALHFDLVWTEKLTVIYPEVTLRGWRDVKVRELNLFNMCHGPVLIWWMKSLRCWDLPVLQDRKRWPVVQFASLIINKTKQTAKYNRSMRVTSRKLMRQLRLEKNTRRWK